MLSDPHGPPARQPCALDRARSSSPQRGPRRSLSGASSPGAPQTGAQEDSTPGARHRERPARCAQPSRPPRARAHGASPPPWPRLRGSAPPPLPAPCEVTNQRPPARGLSGEVVRPGGVGLRFRVQIREPGGGVRWVPGFAGRRLGVNKWACAADPARRTDTGPVCAPADFRERVPRPKSRLQKPW